MDRAGDLERIQRFLNEFDYDNPKDNLPLRDAEICRIARESVHRSCATEWCGWFVCCSPTRRAVDVLIKSKDNSLEDEAIRAFAEGANIHALVPRYRENPCESDPHSYIKNYVLSTMEEAAMKSMNRLVLYLYMLGMDPVKIDKDPRNSYLLCSAKTEQTARLLIAMGASARRYLCKYNKVTPIESIDTQIEHCRGRAERTRLIGLKQVLQSSIKAD